MSTQKYLEYFDSAIGLYMQGLELLNPEKEDVSIISGCILIAIGFEKFIKFCLEKQNQLMVLEKITFNDVLNDKLKNRIGSVKTEGTKITVGLKEGFTRLSIIFPELKKEINNLQQIVDDRNFLVHGSGDFQLNKIEGRIRVNVTDISEIICAVCLNKNPVEVFGIEVWETMKNSRKAYKQAEVLELETRLKFLKRLYSQGEKLSCQKIKFKNKPQVTHISEPIHEPIYETVTVTYTKHTCPICDNDALIETEWWINVDCSDEFGDYNNMPEAFAILSAFICPKCSFTLSDPKEIEILIGEEKFEKMFCLDYPFENYMKCLSESEVNLTILNS